MSRLERDQQENHEPYYFSEHNSEKLETPKEFIEGDIESQLERVRERLSRIELTDDGELKEEVFIERLTDSPQLTKKLMIFGGDATHLVGWIGFGGFALSGWIMEMAGDKMGALTSARMAMVHVGVIVAGRLISHSFRNYKTKNE